MLNHLFFFLDATQPVQPPWSLAAFFFLTYGSESFPGFWWYGSFIPPVVSLSQQRPHTCGCAISCRMCVIRIRGNNPQQSEETRLKIGFIYPQLECEKTSCWCVCVCVFQQFYFSIHSRWFMQKKKTKEPSLYNPFPSGNCRKDECTYWNI